MRRLSLGVAALILGRVSSDLKRHLLQAAFDKLSRFMERDDHENSLSRRDSIMNQAMVRVCVDLPRRGGLGPERARWYEIASRNGWQYVTQDRVAKLFERSPKRAVNDANGQKRASKNTPVKNHMRIHMVVAKGQHDQVCQAAEQLDSTESCLLRRLRSSSDRNRLSVRVEQP